MEGFNAKMGSIDSTQNVRNTKSNQRTKHMSSEMLETTLRIKKECNAKAMCIVERLLENTVSKEWFLDCLKYISDSHFQDVIEERAITKLCGYPLCTEMLKVIPYQQYHISTRGNKVYDITERKNFCSNKCYTTSKYLKGQLLTNPLWLRDKDKMPKFKLNTTAGNKVGDVVDLGQSSTLKAEVVHLNQREDNLIKFTSTTELTHQTLSKLVAQVDKLDLQEKETQINQQPQLDATNKANETLFLNSTKGVINEIEKQKTVHEECNKLKGAGGQQNVTCKQKSLEESLELLTSSICDHELPKNTQSLNENQIKVSNSLVESLEKICITDNMSHNRNIIETHLKVDKQENSINTCTSSSNIEDETVKNKYQVKKSKHKNKITATHKNETSDIPPVASTVTHIEKCLHEWFTIDSLCFLFGEEKVKEMVTEKGESIKEYYKAVASAAWDPELQQRYARICRKLNLMELEDRRLDDSITNVRKPVPDYKTVQEDGKELQLKVKSYFHGRTSYESVDKSQDKDAPCIVLPLVDLHAQKALRRRLVLDRLNRILPDLLRTFDLSSRDVSTDVRGLVTTFKLGANNITFQVGEWSFLGLIFIKMLSMKDTQLKAMLETEQVIKYQTLMLISFQQDGGYLDRLMVWLTDIDNFLSKSN